MKPKYMKALLLVWGFAITAFQHQRFMILEFLFSHSGVGMGPKWSEHHLSSLFSGVEINKFPSWDTHGYPQIFRDNMDIQ